MGTDIIVVLGAFIGTCAYFSYKSGMKYGYETMAFEVATAIVDIAIEKEKIEVMKLEVKQIQRECLQLMEENQT
jgi:coenzyme F420-reducing hydrogenase delta subunit